MVNVVSGLEHRGDPDKHGMYMLYACAFVMSLASSNPGARLYFFVDGLQDSDIDRLRKVSGGLSLVIVRLSEDTRGMLSRAVNPKLGTIVSVRCYLHRLMDIPECLWIDCDTVVLGNLDDMVDECRSACRANGSFVSMSIDSIHIGGGRSGCRNAGVAYFDLDGLRRSGAGERMVSRIESVCSEGSKRSNVADQDAMNFIGAADCSVKWNYHRHPSEFDRCCDEYVRRAGEVDRACIYHACGRKKERMPYLYGDMPDSFFLWFERVSDLLGPSVFDFDRRRDFRFRMSETSHESLRGARLSVFMTTLDRTADACLVCRGLLTNLRFSGKTRFFVSAQKGMDGHNSAIRSVFSMLGRSDDLVMIELDKDENTLGRAINAGLDKAFEWSDICLRTEDDWYLHRPFGLDHAYMTLSNDSRVFQIKLSTFDVDPRIRAFAYGSGMYDRVVDDRRVASHGMNLQCALVHRRAYDVLGRYIDGSMTRGLEDVEPEFSRRFDRLTDFGHRDNHVVLWPHFFPKRDKISNWLPFVHIGRSHHGLDWLFPVPPEFRHIDSDSADMVVRALLGGDKVPFKNRFPTVPSYIMDAIDKEKVF